MKKFISLLAVAALITGWSTPSQAGNPYASANIGIAWFNDIDVNEPFLGGRSLEMMSSETLAEFDSGIAFTAALGYDFGDTRIEAEIGHQENDFTGQEINHINGISLSEEVIIVKGAPESNDMGDFALTTFMLNGYYDIQPSASSDVELFVTAGVGGVFYNIDENSYGYENTHTGSTWAYQIGAGAAYPVSDGLMVEGRYRYMNTAEFNEGPEDWAIDLSTHSMLVGLRYNL